MTLPDTTTVTYAEHEALMLDYAASEKERRSLARRLIALEAEHKRVEDTPEAQKVAALLELWWREVKNSDPRVAYELDSSRAPKVRSSLKRRVKIAKGRKDIEDPEAEGFDICRRAILGVKYDDWAMGRIKKSGGKSFNDIAEHVLNTDGDIEKFAKLYDDRHDELDERRVIRAVEKGMENSALQHLEQEQGRKEYQRRVIAFGDTMCPWDRMIEALRDHGSRVEFYQGQPDSFKAQCPAHDDQNPSLGVKRTGDGRLLLFCWAGCETADILGALGLAFSDLFDGQDRPASGEGSRLVSRSGLVPLHLRRAMRELLGEEKRAAA